MGDGRNVIYCFTHRAVSHTGQMAVMRHKEFHALYNDWLICEVQLWYSHLTKTGVPSSQNHWLPTLLIPRKNFPEVWIFLLAAYSSNLSCLSAVCGIISWALGFKFLHCVRASALEAGVVIRATQPWLSSQSNPLGQTREIQIMKLLNLQKN